MVGPLLHSRASPKPKTTTTTIHVCMCSEKPSNTEAENTQPYSRSWFLFSSQGGFAVGLAHGKNTAARDHSLSLGCVLTPTLRFDRRAGAPVPAQARAGVPGGAATAAATPPRLLVRRPPTATTRHTLWLRCHDPHNHDPPLLWPPVLSPAASRRRALMKTLHDCDHSMTVTTP